MRSMKKGFFLLLQKLLFPKQQIFGSSKLKEFADDNFRFDENGSECSKKVENTVEKGEIAHSEHFSFSHIDSRLVPQIRKKKGLFQKG